MAIPFYAKLLDSIFAVRDITALRRSHAIIIILGFSGNDLLRSKLSAAYANCGFLREAKIIFSRANRRPIFLYNSLIRAHANRRQFLPCLRLYRDLLRECKIPDPRTISSILSVCGEAASLRYGRILHCTALIMGYSLEIFVVNSLVTMYAKCGDLFFAKYLFEKMSDRNVVTWTAMIGGLGAHGFSREALKVFDEMVQAGVQPDAMVITAVLSACVHGGLVEDGERAFREMEERFGVKPTVEHVTCMVEIMGRAGRLEEAEVLVEGMECEPDEALWGALLCACKAHGKLDMALRVAQKACSKELT